MASQILTKKYQKESFPCYDSGCQRENNLKFCTVHKGKNFKNFFLVAYLVFVGFVQSVVKISTTSENLNLY